MPRLVTVVTPENVRIEYELGGLASRAGALAVDTALQGAAIVLTLWLRIYVAARTSPSVATYTGAAAGIASFLIYYGYFVYFETVWNGQTPGKRYARLRAVREGGMPIDLACAAVRDLVRIVDFLPVGYMLGAIVVVASGRNKRLGDFAAGTMVVKERRAYAADVAPRQPSAYPDRPETWCVRSIELVRPEEFEAAKRFLARKAELDEAVREEIAARIARPMMSRLGIEDDGRVRYSEFLAEIHERCAGERGMR